jgi:hypothetical protein
VAHVPTFENDTSRHNHSWLGTRMTEIFGECMGQRKLSSLAGYEVPKIKKE